MRHRVLFDGASCDSVKEAMPINAIWHKAHRLPKNASVEERIAWHKEHAAACGCRPIPPKLIEEMKKKRLV